ncbi:serine/threonine-protein kinase pim-1-like [Neoarius graeffei]|uniref:serine/threonine-protein kinase pim-1-like n=1 Tax=Neoarius graeffei TaxID=443677 RepID=UPI00298C8950|nr:serine/threonine-protein kinase pim-1-like [Neoarius graeffei]
MAVATFLRTIIAILKSCLIWVKHLLGDYITPEQQEVWDVDGQSQGTLAVEISTHHLTAMELPDEMCDVDPESDDMLMSQNPTTYGNILDLQPEEWDVDCEVAIKYVPKDPSDVYITIPGESCKLHTEVALMQIVSKPPHCKNVLQLLDLFDMPNYLLLVLERPIHCMDVYNLCMSHKGILDEPLAKIIMLQVVEAARHCYSLRVFHRDIKAENLLFNTDTMDVKLIDFGCGDLWQDTPYEEYAGTPQFWPPEWIQQDAYYADSATVWGLGILLFSLVCGEMPFQNEEEIVDGSLHFKPSLSQACHHLIKWCLEQDPTKWPSLTQISEHEWFTDVLQEQVLDQVSQAKQIKPN